MVSTSACSGLIAWFELLTRSSTGAAINSSVIASVIRSNTDPVHHMGITDECSERFSCDVGSSRMDERFLSPRGPSTERSAGAESRTPLYILPWLSLVRIPVCYGDKVAVVFCGPPFVGCVSRRTRCKTRPILGWETVVRVLTLRPGWFLRVSPLWLFPQAS